MKKINFKSFISFYRMNRLWGDSMLEAAYWALRGKAFHTSYNGILLNKQIITELKQDLSTEKDIV